MKDSLNVAIAGASGYVGIQLIKILLKHPKVKILFLYAKKSIKRKIKDFDNTSFKSKLPIVTKFSKKDLNKIDVIFTALPNGEAQKIAQNLPNHVKLIDLSADFRLKNFNLYKKWYGLNHNSKQLIKQSLYAITEFKRNNLQESKIISCPGCYPTSVQIPLIPLIKNKMIKLKNITIDSKSGYSGGGKNIKKKFKKIDILKSVSAYGVGSHRHMAEIDQELSLAAQKNVKVSFTPHLIPMFRGILSTIYIETKDKINAAKIYNFLKSYHKNNYFIKISKFNKYISTDSVINTNFCQISICEDRINNRVIILSTIDNLIKGASGQAVQNMNVAFNLNEKTGLL